MPAGAAAFANWSTRTVVIPPIVDAETFADWRCTRSGTCSRADALAASRTGRIHPNSDGTTASGARWTHGPRR